MRSAQKCIVGGKQMLKKLASAAALMTVVCWSSSQAADEKSPKADGAEKSKTSNNAKADPLAGDKTKISIVFDHVLPNVPGKSMKGVLVEYEPGGSTPKHTHPKSAFIYATVLEGEIQSQVNNGPVKTYKVGENFSEMPGDVHGVSANASKTKPAKLLAVFVVNSDEKELTTICK